MKNASETKKAIKKASKKAKPKPGTYEALLKAVEIAQSTEVKATWVRQ